jgi:NodT family efflux transporter outer membrane factor (OMF) lipoprotein
VSEIGAGLDWEIDVFGRIDAQTQADRLAAKARQAALDTARLRISAEVARTYFQAVAQARQIDLLKGQVESDREFVNLTQRRFDQGVANKVDVLQAKSQLAETRSRIPPVEAELGVLERRLDILLGKAPDGESRIGKDDTFITMADLLPLGVPSDLLLERPDLRAARHELAAADAEIAAAIARRLPRFTLDGSYLLADGPGFAGPVASISAMVVQPLLDWGQRRAQVTENKALYQQRLAEFTLTYITAIEDVENALEQERRQRTFLKRTRERRDVLQDTLEQTKARFTQGITDYLPVLDAVEELQIVERELVRARSDLIEHRIDLHRALGGQMVPETDATDTHKPEKET